MGPAGRGRSPDSRVRPRCSPRRRADTACRPSRTSPANPGSCRRIATTRAACPCRCPRRGSGCRAPAPNTRPDCGDDDAVDRSPGAPVPVMPRAASAGSSPKRMRHLMAGSFRSYFTIDVNGGLMRLPTVLYSLIVGRSYSGTPSGYGGSAPRPRPPGASGRVHADPIRRSVRAAHPIRRAPPPRPPPDPPRPRPPAGASSESATRLSTSAAREMRERRHASLAGRDDGANRGRVEARRAGGDVVRRIRGRRRRAARRCRCRADRRRGTSGSSAGRRPARAALRRHRRARRSRRAAAAAGCPGCRARRRRRRRCAGSAAMPPNSTPPLLVGMCTVSV